MLSNFLLYNIYFYTFLKLSGFNRPHFGLPSRAPLLSESDFTSDSLMLEKKKITLPTLIYIIINFLLCAMQNILYLNTLTL